LEKYELDLVAEQEVRQVVGGSQPAGDFIFSIARGLEIIT